MVLSTLPVCVPNRLRDWPREIRTVLVLSLTMFLGVVILAAFAFWDANAASGESGPLWNRLRDRLAGPQSVRSRAETLLTASEGPFNGFGTMRPAFTTKSHDWEALIEPMSATQRQTLEAERDAERLALLAWIQSGIGRVSYEEDSFPRPSALTGQPISQIFLSSRDRIKIRSLIASRCVDCHAEGGRSDRAAQVPLDSYDRLQPYFTGKNTARLTSAEWVKLLIGPGTTGIFFVTGMAMLVSFTGLSQRIRLILMLLPLTSLGFVAVCCGLARVNDNWFIGVEAGGSLAVVSLVVQIAIVLGELLLSFGQRPLPRRDVRNGAASP